MQGKTVVIKRSPSKIMWIWGIVPLILLAVIIYLVSSFGTGIKDKSTVPIEALDVQRIVLTDEGFTLKVLNSGPDSVTIAQVLVNDAFWNASFQPDATIERLNQTNISIPYGWVEGDPYEIKLITSNGLLFTGEIAAAAKTPVPDANRFAQYALIGFYVGVIPVGLGLLWFPFLRRFSDRGMQGVLALTVGLLFFLVIDTFQEGLELGAEAPGIFQGTGLVWFGALISFLFLLALDQANERRGNHSGKQVAYKIAGGIGLHNLGEGLAIGAAFALGEASLGTFLIIGFTLHNITEGVGIAAPLLKERPTWRTFLGLAVLGGGPAIIGTWIGGFVFNDTLAALFFGIGAGAIIQVIFVISKMIFHEAAKSGRPAVSWVNFASLTLGIALMYATALFVSI
ncbi:metal transporter [Paenibacillus baekrokdamisoli]|uniref:Metal transporter n=1 Tax=Paenibacillus baekrokdamisoli TaxID=1712516 RepID=A0A3G9IYW5_9BACL|nr:ZIP family metal transporter [Paenibacillus baekrokdamisoli]MBB3070349.1 zinc transporter ZupT [Paenibacillus baekrokdamisoli]BBH21355.1 metal transporter [Paenibacillus baekrokdamisoli]